MVHRTRSSQVVIDLVAEQQRYYHDLLASGDTSAGVLAGEPRNLHDAGVQQRAELDACVTRHVDVYLGSMRVKKELVGLLEESSGLVESLESMSVPSLENDVKQFKANALEESKTMTSLALLLENQDALVDILEIPSLMDACVREEQYDAALELRSFLDKMRVLHGRGRASSNATLRVIEAEVERVVERMKEQLFEQMERDVGLTVCLQMVGTLRRVLGRERSELELRREFLERRGRWIDTCLGEVRFVGSESESSAAALEYIRGLTDVFRLQVSDVMMQYRTIFFGGTGSTSSSSHTTRVPLHDPSYVCGTAWMTQYIHDLEETLPRITDGAHLASVLEACSYAGRALARVGLDPRGSILFSLVEDGAVRIFDGLLDVAEETFEDMVAVHRWVAIPVASYCGEQDEQTADKIRVERKETSTLSVSPPMVLVEHGPLAVYTNGVLAAFNELRQCAPVAVRSRVEARLRHSIELVERVLGAMTHPRDNEEARVYNAACAVAKDVMAPFLLQQVMGRVFGCVVSSI